MLVLNVHAAFFQLLLSVFLVFIAFFLLSFLSFFILVYLLFEAVPSPNMLVFSSLSLNYFYSYWDSALTFSDFMVTLFTPGNSTPEITGTEVGWLDRTLEILRKIYRGCRRELKQWRKEDGLQQRRLMEKG